MTAGLNWGDPFDSLAFTIIPDAILDPYHDADEGRICPRKSRGLTRRNIELRDLWDECTNDRNPFIRLVLT